MDILPSLWAIGHMGSTSFGFLHLNKLQPNLITVLTSIVEQNFTHYSVKG